MLRRALGGDLTDNWGPGLSPDRHLSRWPGVTVYEGRVVSLRLTGWKLEGPLPSEIWGLSALRELELGYNRLSGEIPAEIGDLSNLEIIYMSGNELTGAIPPEIGNLSSLRELDLENNQLTGEIPPQIGLLPNLEDLNLSHNQLTGEIPRSLADLPLSSLSLAGNQLTGIVPSELYLVETLNLEGNQLMSPHRAVLIAIYNSTGGPQWKSGQRWLTDVPIGGWEGVTIDANGMVTELDLGQFGLSGEIPPDIGDLTGLRVLNLSRNDLTGEIPPEIGQLSTLEALVLSRNQLTGEIPPEIGQLSNLENLGLYQNRLTGEIPAWLDDLPLRYLSLGGNQLTGCLLIERWRNVNYCDCG